MADSRSHAALFTLNIVSLSGTGALNLKVEPRRNAAKANSTLYFRLST